MIGSRPEELNLSALANVAEPEPCGWLDLAKHVDSRTVGAPRTAGTLASTASNQEHDPGTTLDEFIYPKRHAAQRLSSAAARQPVGWGSLWVHDRCNAELADNIAGND